MQRCGKTLNPRQEMEAAMDLPREYTCGDRDGDDEGEDLGTDDGLANALDAS